MSVKCPVVIAPPPSPDHGKQHYTMFLVADSQLCKRLCPSVGPSVGPSVMVIELKSGRTSVFDAFVYV